MRASLVLGFLLASAPAAMAYDGFSPLSGPNTVVPSPICAVVNFGFCPQPPQPAPLAYDPNEVAARPDVALPPPVTTPRRHRHVRHVVPSSGT